MTPEELLKKLGSHFYIDHNGDVSWMYIECLTLHDMDYKTAEEFKKYVEDGEVCLK